MPSAMAPLETMMTSRPCTARPASWRAHSPMACSSSPRPSLVTRLEPTLTTMRRAWRSNWAASLIAATVPKARVDLDRGLLGDLLRLDVLEDLLDEVFAAFTGERRD